MNENEADINWLGEENAYLGPAVRAALGILLESDEWAWWDDPATAVISLDKTIPKNGFVKWGGDSSVLEANRWVDSRRATAIGQAFKALDRRGPTRIKVARSVWNWPGGPETVDSVTSELSQLVGAGHVFPEWEKNTKPRFPHAMASADSLRVVTSPSLPIETLLNEGRQHVKWVADATIADIVVAESFEALRATEAAQVVILYGEKSRDALARVSTLREQLSAQSAIYVEADASRIGRWLQLLIASWAMPGQSLASAIETVGVQSGVRARILSSTQVFLASKDSFQQRRLPTTTIGQLLPGVSAAKPHRETAAQNVVEALQNSTRPMDLRPVHRSDRPRPWRPSPPVERVVNLRVIQGAREITSWPSEGLVNIEVDIRVKTPFNELAPSFPEDRIEWENDTRTLQVHLFEVGREPVTQGIELPKTGNSTVAQFFRESTRGLIDLRFLVSDGAQILQTARFKAASGEPFEFFIENIVTPVHRSKLGFDVALLINDSLGNERSMTLITDNGQAFFSPLSEHETENARISLLQVLEQAVANPKAPFASLMLKLANLGSLLLKGLQKSNPDWPGTVNRVQLVTQSDAFFPIEYLYEGKVPELTNADLCPERAGCLNAGQAIADCGIRAAGEKLCPMGFLGISGIIERHTWRADQHPRIWGASGTSNPKRQQINDLSRIVFAANDKADDFKDADVAPHEIVRIANIENSLSVKRTIGWEDWKSQVSKNSPSMLLLIVHLEDEAVYLEKDVGVNLSGITESYVGGAPVVIAIGCSSGLGGIPGGGLPAVLQRCGARVVVAAMTTVLGRHANRAARDLAKHFREAAKSPGPVYLGQAITQLRRRLISEELALGLVVVAFGDADIVLGNN